MQLKVIHPDSKTRPWYGGGLHFTCSQCGNCCTGQPGYVWISSVEIERLAKHLNASIDEVIEKYCRRVGSKYSLKERRNPHGEYDCIFLKEIQPSRGDGKTVVYSKRVCTIYDVRPLQCRTWPFWDGNLASPEAWTRAAERCHGMNNGSRIFSVEQIEALRDAKDWPQRPPTSHSQRKARSR